MLFPYIPQNNEGAFELFETAQVSLIAVDLIAMSTPGRLLNRHRVPLLQAPKSPVLPILKIGSPHAWADVETRDGKANLSQI